MRRLLTFLGETVDGFSMATRLFFFPDSFSLRSCRAAQTGDISSWRRLPAGAVPAELVGGLLSHLDARADAEPPAPPSPSHSPRRISGP